MVDLINHEYGFIYAIQSLDLVKIGVAKSIKNRLNTMRLHNPHGCKVIYKRRAFAPYRFERRMHEFLADKAIGREWFRVSLEEVRTAANAARIASIKDREEMRAAIAKIGTRLTRSSGAQSDINSLAAETVLI